MSDTDTPNTDALIDNGEQRNVAFKENERSELSSAIEQFLSKGGNVKQIKTGEMTDPPKKPENNYGSRPI